MSDSQAICLYCARSVEEIPLLALNYKDREYWICPQHFPILIHQPQNLVGKLPGAEHLSPHEH
jgi:hypothetical protein